MQTRFIPLPGSNAKAQTIVHCRSFSKQWKLLRTRIAVVLPWSLESSESAKWDPGIDIGIFDMLQALLVFSGSWNWNPLLTTLRHRQIWMLLPQSEMCLVFRYCISVLKARKQDHAACSKLLVCHSQCQTYASGYWLCRTHTSVAPRLRTIRSITLYLICICSFLQFSAIYRNGVRGESTVSSVLLGKFGNCSDQ